MFKEVRRIIMDYNDLVFAVSSTMHGTTVAVLDRAQTRIRVQEVSWAEDICDSLQSYRTLNVIGSITYFESSRLADVPPLIVYAGDSLRFKLYSFCDMLTSPGSFQDAVFRADSNEELIFLLVHEVLKPFVGMGRQVDGMFNSINLRLEGAEYDQGPQRTSC